MSLVYCISGATRFGISFCEHLNTLTSTNYDDSNLWVWSFHRPHCPGPFPGSVGPRGWARCSSACSHYVLAIPSFRWSPLWPGPATGSPAVPCTPADDRRKTRKKRSWRGIAAIPAPHMIMYNTLNGKEKETNCDLYDTKLHCCLF